MDDLKQIIANNITKLRKGKKLTQAEFAKEINYSDKSISKWERAESIPDIIILKQVADFFGTTVDYLLQKHTDNESILVVKNKKRIKINKISLTLLAICPVWLLSTIVFAIVSIIFNKNVFYEFYISIPISILIALIFNSIWGIKRKNYIIISCLVWSVLLCIYLCLLKFNIWQIFLLGIPAEASIILWSTLKKH